MSVTTLPPGSGSGTTNPGSSPVTYPFDPTGTAPTNLITGEQQILSEPVYEDYHFLVPYLAPFFSSTMQVSIRQLDGTVKQLVEGVDYYCTNIFIAASRACAKPIYGSISFLDLTLAGVVTFNYQTLGGEWTINLQEIANILASTLYNPRVTSWDQVTYQPATFPVIDHEWDLVDLVGETQLIASIEDIVTAINSKTYDTTLLNNAVTDSGNALTIAQAAAVTADGAMAIANALNPAAQAAALQALQTAIAAAQGALPAQLTTLVNQAITTANAAMAAVTALQAVAANEPGTPDDILYFNQGY